jgi:ribose transport system permease protein
MSTASEHSVDALPPLDDSAVESPSRLNLATLRDYGIVLATVALFVVLTFASSVFLTEQNLGNIIDQWAPTGLMACAGTLVILAGGFDLSVGAIFAVSAVASARIATSVGPLAGLLAGVLAGLILGMANGLLTTVFRINHFVATIATGIVFTGLTSLISQGFVVDVPSPSYQNLGTNEILGLHYSVFIYSAFALLCGFILVRMTVGRYVRATGANMEAARLSGLPTTRVICFTYALSGLAAGIGAVIVASRTGTAEPNVDPTVAANVWAAILVGGTSLFGGRGAIWRSVLGVFLIALIGNGFDLLNLNSLYQQIITGTIILLAVGFDALARRQAA